MAQNFLYMFEFVVDDLLITRPNHCAPEEYPTCCEITFRSSVYVSICDREFGECIDKCAPKCGKLCLFSLESPITDKDRLLIHIYKKKTDKCKFLVGATDIPIKALFDKVTANFHIENPNWMEQLAKQQARMPDPKTPSKTAIIDNECEDEPQGRRERLCPTSELTKRLLPLFNMKNMQTGNLVLIMRLVCNGPAVVSSFPFSKLRTQPCAKKQPICSPPCPKCPKCPACPACTACTTPTAPASGPCVLPDPCKREMKKPTPCRRYFACNADKLCPCDECEDCCDRGECPAQCKKSKKKHPKPCPPCRSPQRSHCCQPDPCKKHEPKAVVCQHFFNNACAEKCPCEECMDECEAEECSDNDDSSDPCCLPPCFITPSKPDPGPDAYEEFEACLNGSGLTIRVLKDTHQVDSITDGTENIMDNPESDCEKCVNDVQNTRCESLTEILQRSLFASNHVKKHTAGPIINHPKLPKIRANIKYSGNDRCASETYHVPYSKLKEYCEYQENKLDLYRKKQQACEDPPVTRPQQADDIRNCCLQVDPQDIRNALKGINMDTRKKGIEVCYKTCNDTDSDIFLVKLGSKQRCQRKKNSIEIELKTPKQPLTLPSQKVTTETQITEAELDAALANKCSKKKKGKKGRKGKK